MEIKAKYVNPQQSNSTFTTPSVSRYEDVRSTPAWAAKDLEAELEIGKTQITFYATSPFSREVASCSFTIHVRDIIPPRVYNCPTDFNVYLKADEKEKEVNVFVCINTPYTCEKIM